MEAEHVLLTAKQASWLLVCQECRFQCQSREDHWGMREMVGVVIALETGKKSDWSSVLFGGLGSALRVCVLYFSGRFYSSGSWFNKTSRVYVFISVSWDRCPWGLRQLGMGMMYCRPAQGRFE